LLFVNKSKKTILRFYSEWTLTSWRAFKLVSVKMIMNSLILSCIQNIHKWHVIIYFSMQINFFPPKINSVLLISKKVYSCTTPCIQICIIIKLPCVINIPLVIIWFIIIYTYTVLRWSVYMYSYKYRSRFAACYYATIAYQKRRTQIWIIFLMNSSSYPQINFKKIMVNFQIN